MLILSADRERLDILTYRDVKRSILERRRAIRKSRDMKGDDRCWLDNYLIWMAFENSPPDPRKPLPYGEAMRLCAEFYEHCRAENEDPTPPDAIMDPDHWDDDLYGISKDRLVDKLVTIQLVIATFMDIYDRHALTTDDYRNLYAILPEKIPADFRLPPRDEFLGTDRPDAGCPRFWMSHSSCKGPCNLHAWGPCINHDAD